MGTLTDQDIVCIMGQLNIKQRYIIELMYATQASLESIGNAINRDKSVVSREIKRNLNPKTRRYCALYADALCKKRHRNKNKHIVLDEAMKAYIKGHLKEGLSLEQIKGRSHLNGVKCVPHETIYLFIWEDKKNGRNLYKYLRHKHKRYSKRGSKNEFRGKMEGRVSIEQRHLLLWNKRVDLEILMKNGNPTHTTRDIKKAL